MRVRGSTWWGDYRQRLLDIGIDSEVEMEPAKERFRFGGGGVLESVESFRFPAVVAGIPLFVRARVVLNTKLSLLPRHSEAR